MVPSQNVNINKIHECTIAKINVKKTNTELECDALFQNIVKN